ncbi:hypothetical protein D9V37_10450 [Nocardioides mangrovicus]|uniref:Uncharacterized protein n=1 Tax=Nocardioides mangrovicus TaxID=2478913 RepID=A0A3L8P3F6_9ACTN|nr:hypothetical protein [Nocardioides mangrovicus]RLV48998.1 hypothetical protein D9V37_10450 [Nocardioides mangrovicus]
MRLSLRAGHAPEEVLTRLQLARGERVLAAAEATAVWLLGTRLALYVVAPHEVQRIGWEQVEHAGWDAEADLLVVAEVGEWGHPRPVHRFGLAEQQERPGRLLDLLRERVSASVLLQRRVPIGENGLGVTLHARRAPGDGRIGWFVTYDDGLDPDVVRPQVEAALAAARTDVEP